MGFGAAADGEGDVCPWPGLQVAPQNSLVQRMLGAHNHEVLCTLGPGPVWWPTWLCVSIQVSLGWTPTRWHWVTLPLSVQVVPNSTPWGCGSNTLAPHWQGQGATVSRSVTPRFQAGLSPSHALNLSCSLLHF